MKIADREKIFNKYGGRCSYCGCDLTGTRWHADHANPVERKYEWKGGGLFLTGTNTPLTKEHFKDGNMPDHENRRSKLVAVGYHKPENDVIENMMPACASCNINKHSMDIEQFRAFIGRFINSLNRDSVQYKIAKRYGLIKETESPVIFHFETLSPHP